uniref:Uncharacterized protein n=1 Tax=Lepeophtheirus salmonis TaxID=72036 RepID=A0A0K2V7E4_LEPSM
MLIRCSLEPSFDFFRIKSINH